MVKSVNHIKNICCTCCIEKIEKILIELGIPYLKVKMGEVILQEKPTKRQMKLLNNRLKANNHEFIGIKKELSLVSIKFFIHQWVNIPESCKDKKLSDYQSETGLYQKKYKF